MSFIPPYQETAAILAAQNPLVPRGVIASETDTGVMKVGDGVTRYNSLSTAFSGTYASPQGAWSSATAYTVNAVVTYNGGTYRAKVASTNITPDSDVTKWESWGGGSSASSSLYLIATYR